ncbi:bifunctional riboflavin kinase/FAD synthetase [Changchengzhania lutea]|uniref:bifunctional riboflavin kinase/FAD synthetase n=1 Tax=Changchengzhania lutea TaxID=2049305 RepID=UPI00115F25B0|nr:bifunctional riboflavin kinase/FAD synthetase [Changchengzhania lutea]
MSEVKNIETYKASDATVVTIGTFDGVHVGHQKIINRLIATGKEHNLKSVILTFFPHPRMVLQKDSNIKLINTIQERRDILDDLGLDYLLVKEFTKEFSRLSAEDFVKTILVDTLHAKKVIIGYDHRFGRNRNASIKDLKHFGTLYNFEVEEISAKDIDAVAVSSTKIRSALSIGDISKANAFLGYNFMLHGEVVKGKGLGRQLDFPTANLNIKEDYKLIPKQGSYIVRATIANKLVYGMMNIGVNPTVHGEKETIEIHFFNFSSDIYGRFIKVELLERLRDEQKFDHVDDLKYQLLKDKEIALKYIALHHA